MERLHLNPYKSQKLLCIWTVYALQKSQWQFLSDRISVPLHLLLLTTTTTRVAYCIICIHIEFPVDGIISPVVAHSVIKFLFKSGVPLGGHWTHWTTVGNVRPESGEAWNQIAQWMCGDFIKSTKTHIETVQCGHWWPLMWIRNNYLPL